MKKLRLTANGISAKHYILCCCTHLVHTSLTAYPQLVHRLMHMSDTLRLGNSSQLKLRNKTADSSAAWLKSWLAVFQLQLQHLRLRSLDESWHPFFSVHRHAVDGLQ
jgi:hypothetical protein